MKNAFRLSIFCLLLTLSGVLKGQVIINEVRYVGTDQVELKNIGTTTINVTNWWFCHLFSYSQFSSLTVTGNLNMAPGDIIVIDGLILNNNASDLGIYNSSSFGSSTAMQDFVQWGAGGLGRESVAAAKGIWTAGDFVPTVSGASSSIEFDGCGDGSGFWSEATTPSFGSENSNLVTVDGGTVSTSMGADSIEVCLNDPASAMISFDSTGTSGPSFAYVVTDDNGIILGLPPGDMVDFSTAPAGVCLVWGLSYSGTVTAQIGDDAAQVALSDGCFDLSSNFVTVIRNSVDGGTISNTLGQDTVYYCISGTGGGNGVTQYDSTGTAGPNYAYVVTDNNGVILAFPPADMVDVSTAPIGECWVWGLSYSGNVTAQVGDNATQVALSDGCFDLSDNFIVLFRDSVDGGMVMTSAGEDTVEVCLNDSLSTVISFDSTGTFGPNFGYVVTDNNGVILGLPPGDMVNFGGAGVGECWVWGLSYSGTVTAQVGDTASAVDLTDGCYDLSDNFVVVFRNSVDGGTISNTLGQDTVYYCISGTGGGNGVTQYDSTGTAGPNYAYVVTDNNGVILAFPPADMVDVSTAPIGECWVWGLSYSGNVTAQVGDNATQVALSDGCFDLSDNFIVLFRDSVDGGMVMTSAGEDTVEVCLNDSLSTVISFDSTGTFGPNFGYVVTDNNGVILGLPPGDMVNFGGAGVGECWVWGLSYSGTVTAQVGDTASAVDLTDGCYDLSDNFVVVFRNEVDGGTISTNFGEDTVYYCISGNGGGNGITEYDNFNSSGPNYAYVVTDPNGVIVGLPPADMVDVTGAPIGECWVWGLAYSGNLLAQLGDNATQIALSDGCFDLSDNFVVLFRDSVDGGDVLTTLGEDTVQVCINDPSTAVLNFDSSNAFGPNFGYVVTDASGTILGLPPGNQVDFSGAGVGECWVWGLSYSGTITAQIGDIATNVALTDGCFDLSDEFVVVFRDSVDGGMVTTMAGMDTVYVCLTDTGETAGIVNFDSQGAFGPNFRYVVTDPTTEILGLPPANSVNFLGAGVGECWVWGLSYNGNVTAQLGDIAAQTSLSDACFDLSDNFVVVFRDTTSAACGTVGIADALALESFSIFPVPTQDLLNISFATPSTSSRETSLAVFNSAGQEILQQVRIASPGVEQEIQLNLDRLSDGIYMIVVQNGDRIASRRFIKE